MQVKGFVDYSSLFSFNFTPHFPQGRLARSFLFFIKKKSSDGDNFFYAACACSCHSLQ